MSLVPRWLTHLLVITLVGSGVPRASVRPTVLANPQPQPATAPVTLNDELPPLPDVPHVALPLVDKTSPRPTIPVTTTAHIFSRMIVVWLLATHEAALFDDSRRSRCAHDLHGGR